MSEFPTITSKTIEKLDRICAEVSSNKRYPAVFATVINANGFMFEHYSGKIDGAEASKGNVNEDTVLHLFSMTKSVVAVCILQLMDRGIIPAGGLDDSSWLARHLPEISPGKLQLLCGLDGQDGMPILREPEHAITLRMLLTHTSGLAYPFVSRGRRAGIDRWLKLADKKGLFEPGVTFSDYVQPVVFEPGTAWAYGPGIDFAGELVSRLSGLSLEDYLQRNVFGPIGIQSMTFLPSAKTLRHLMRCGYYDTESNRTEMLDGNPFGKPLSSQDVTFFSGGGGLYGTARDYSLYLQAILRCSPSYANTSGQPLLSVSSYQELFSPCLPDPSAENMCISDLFDLVREVKDARPVAQPNASNVQFSLGFCIGLIDSANGRRQGSANWSGAAKTLYWLDPATGIACFFGTQILDQAQEPFYSSFEKFERAVYDGLANDGV